MENEGQNVGFGGKIRWFMQFFWTARPGDIEKKPLPGGGRGESEITSRSLNAKLDTAQIPSSAGEVK